MVGNKHKAHREENMPWWVTCIVEVWLYGRKPGLVDVGEVLRSGVLWYIVRPVHNFTNIQDLKTN